MKKTPYIKEHTTHSRSKLAFGLLAIFFILLLWQGNVSVAKMVQRPKKKKVSKKEAKKENSEQSKKLKPKRILKKKPKLEQVDNAAKQNAVALDKTKQKSWTTRQKVGLVSAAAGALGAALWWYKGTSSVSEILTKAASSTTSWVLAHKKISALGVGAVASVSGVLYLYKHYFPEVLTERNITQVAAGAGIGAWLSSSFGAVGVSASSLFVWAGLSGWAGNKVFEKSGGHKVVKDAIEGRLNAVLPTKEKVVGLAKDNLPALLGGGEKGAMTNFLEEHWGGDDGADDAAGVAAYIGTKVADLIGVFLGVCVMYMVMKARKKAREKVVAKK